MRSKVHPKYKWKKLHLGVDRSGSIVGHALTAATVDDATAGIELIEAVDGAIRSVTADGAYDTIAIYEAATVRGARVVIPPLKSAVVSSGRSPQLRRRDRTILRVTQLGRRQWKKASGYHRQARAENAFFRYKSINGDGLCARHSEPQQAETLIACSVLHRMTALGRPASYPIPR